VADVPFINLKPYVELVDGHPALEGGGFLDDVDTLLGAREFIGGGPTTQRFEVALATKLGAQHAIACANGTDALMLALRAAGIERGHRVAMPNLTFWATFEAIVNVGATPVLLDIDPNDLQMDFETFVRACNNKRFDAAVLVHLYGWCSAKLDQFRSFCRDKRVTLIEDGAQAFGVRFADKSIFEDADAITLSFHPAKVIGGIGDGGAVLTRSARTAARIRALANHGRVAHQEHAVVGWNSRMDAIRAAWLLRALEVSDRVRDARQSIVYRYGTRLPTIDDALHDAGVHNGPTRMGIIDNGYLNIMQVADPRAVAKRLAAAGIETRHVYPLTIADQPGAKQYALSVGELPVSRRFVERAISLPVWYGMKNEDVDRCAAAFEGAVRG
jgi:dTDP-4-amino-4,6-dideoxygalactose transaminase